MFLNVTDQLGAVAMNSPLKLLQEFMLTYYHMIIKCVMKVQKLLVIMENSFV